MTASIAIFLLLTALVVWLSEVTGSFILSSLIVGGFFAVLAAVIYLLAIREGVERIRDQVETVYDVARAAKEGYEWLTDKFLLFMKCAKCANEKGGTLVPPFSHIVQYLILFAEITLVEASKPLPWRASSLAISCTVSCTASRFCSLAMRARRILSSQAPLSAFMRL